MKHDINQSTYRQILGGTIVEHIPSAISAGYNMAERESDLYVVEHINNLIGISNNMPEDLSIHQVRDRVKDSYNEA